MVLKTLVNFRRLPYIGQSFLVGPAVPPVRAVDHRGQPHMVGVADPNWAGSCGFSVEGPRYSRAFREKSQDKFTRIQQN